MPKIAPPSEDDIKADHRRLYRGFHMQSVASYAGASATTYSRQRNPEETLTRNPVWEVQMEMFASVVTNQESIGKGVFRMINDYAIELGLADKEPLEVIRLAIQRLRRITPEDIKGMDTETRTRTIALAAELEEEAGKVKVEVIESRQIVEEKASNARAFQVPRVSG